MPCVRYFLKEKEVEASLVWNYSDRLLILLAALAALFSFRLFWGSFFSVFVFDSLDSFDFDISSLLRCCLHHE